jgi:nitrite reductase (NADH) large subunit
VKKKLAVIGNGMAAGRALERLVSSAPDLYDVVVFNAEPRGNYDRILLSPVLAGEKSFKDIVIHDDDWYARHAITLHKGCPVAAIDREDRTVQGADGIVERYDQLIIATGSVPIVIPVPGHDLSGVVTFRDLDDVDAMRRAAAAGGRAVVIGGGLLGLEAAAGLERQGMAVSVVHLMPTLMERQLDPSAGALLASALASRGIEVLTSANTKAIHGIDRVTGVELSDGRILPADLVVMAVGIRPNTALAKASGLAVNRGIAVEATMRTSDPLIFALGECAEVEGQCFGLVAPLYHMAEVVAAQLTGDRDARFAPAATATRLKVTGINVYSAGDFGSGGGDGEEIVLRDDSAGIYKRLVLRDGRLVGTVLYGETSDGPWFFDMLNQQTATGAIRDRLIFGRAYQTATPLEAYGGRCSVAG